MKKILFINIFAFILGAIGLSAQCTTDVSIYESTTETCAGSSDGTATAIGTGPNGVMYLWSNGQTTATATGLTSGTYTLTVTDGVGCTASESIEITVDPEGVWIMNTSTPVSCNGGSDGTAHASVMTGQAPYTYIWNDPAGTTNADPVGLSAGVYTVTVTDANGCSNAAPVTIEEPTAIVVISNSSNEICFGDGNGSASVTTSGGTGQMTFSWSTGGNSSSINNLTAGNYTVTVTDANACTSVASITVNVTNPQINISGTATIVSCNGGNDGSATANVTSGNGPFTYSWNNGATGATANGLSAGTYTVTVTGTDGCTSTTSIIISEPSQLTITTNNPNTTNITCNGANDGAIMVTTSGGTGTITYTWSNGATTQTISNLSAGTYTVTATDTNGCTVTTTYTITEPAVLSATGSGTDATTVGGTDGTATVTPVGGTGPYTYLWSNGATTQTISNLSAGTYTVTITDANGCTTTTTVVIGEPNATIDLTINSTPSTCGANDGTSTVMASGGFTPYTYLWSDGQTTSTATGLAGGTYTVTVTDNVGNTATTSVTVIETSGVTATASFSNETCSGSGDGHVSVSTSGGVGQMEFLWSNGATTSTVNGLSVGTYTVTVTDQNGCTATASATIELSPEGIWVDITTTHVTCFGGNDGSAASVVTTGVAPYSYAWSNGGNTPTISNLTAGTYTVTVTDVNGCEGIFTTEVTQPTQLTATISSTSIDCGQNNGSASVMVNGGTPGYTYMWNNGATTQDISGVSAGTYTVTATDANGCTVVSSTMINDNNTLAVGPVNTSDPTTAGGTDGSIDIEVTGGTGPYTYMWSNGATTQDISGLSAGCYTVTITDAVGCSITSTHCVNDPDMLNIEVTTTDNGCMGNNMGTATATPTDGTSPYTYMWSTQTGFPLGTTQTITGLTNGTYLVTVTDANGVQGTGTGVVTGSGGVSSSATVVNISCNGANDGSAMANGIGGAPGLNGYQYNWSNGAMTQNISNLAPGDYTVTVSDLEGCTSTSTITVIEPSSITVSSAIGTNPTTAGGSDGAINITVMGGTPGYTFLWSNGATTEDISGLTAGCYTVTITDSNNCTATSETCIVDPLSCSITLTSTPESCDPSMDGSVTATPSAGCPSPFTYSWTDANGNVVGNTATVGGLTTGFYTVTFTDNNGNIITQTVEVTGGNTVMSNATSTNVSCNGGNDGSATGSGSGGSGVYTYSWSNGGNTQTISNLTAGTYTFTVTDQNGCSSVSSVMVTEPSTIITTGTTGTGPTTGGGSDGAIDLVVSGGTAPYTFLWSNGATTEDISGLTAGCYTVTITDSNNCTATSETCIVDPCSIILTSTPESCDPAMDGTVTATPSAGCPSPFNYSWTNANGTVVGNTSTVGGLTAGFYTVTFTDANGNIITQTVEVTGGNTVMSNTTSTNVSCNGGNDGSATGSGSGGSGVYTYSWSNGGNTQTISNLTAGTYTLTVTDQNGCSSVSSVTVTEPSTIITTGTTGTNPSMMGGSDGSIDLVVSGGTAPYTFLWSNGETTEDISGLTAGCYTVTITDSNNCTATSETCITDPPSTCVVIVSSTPESCDPAMDGTVTVSTSGCLAPITIEWTDANGNPIGSTATVGGLVAGTYTVTVMDANVTITQTVEVTGGNNVMSTATAVDVNCNGGADGSATATGSGGNGPYTYLWSNGAMTQDISNLPAGTYTVTVTDDDGCTSISTVVVSEPTQIITTGTVGTNPTVAGGSDGSIDLMVSGGTTPYTFLWSNGETTEDISGLPAGCYTVTITDANNCTATDEICLEDPPLFAISASSTPDPCTVGDNGIIESEVVTGGIAPIDFVWLDSNGDTVGMTAMIPDVPSGEYTVIATDAIGQTDTKTVTVVTEAGPSLTAPDDMITCDENISLGATAASGANIKWYDDLTPPTTEIGNGISLSEYVLSSGENMIFVEAELNGCVTLDTVIINQESMDVSVQATSAFCLGSDGQLMATNNDPQDVVTYQWTPASAFISGDDSATPTLNTNLTGITEVYLATENQHGCLQFDTISVIVQDTAANFIETSNCNPLEVNFANNGSTDYVWDFGDNSPLGSGATPVHNYAAAGTYTVMMVLPAGTPNAGCLPDTVTKVIEVADDPIFNVDFAIDYEACSEDSVMVVFTDNSTNATLDITGWTWDLPGGGTSTSQQDSILIGESGTYTVNVVVTAEDGCTDSLTQSFDVSILDINLLLTDTLCFGEQTQLNPFGNPDYTYDWSNGIGTVLNPTITGDQSADYMVTITDPNVAGCEVERLVSIFVPEVMDDLATSPDTILCIDGNVILDASSALATDYVWSAPFGNQVGTGASFEITNIGEPQYYYVEAIDQYGCSTLDSVFAGNAQIVSLLMGDGDLCLGDETTVTAMTTSAGNSLFYEWTDENGNVIGVEDSLNLSPTASSNYNVNVSNEFGCDFNSDFSLNVVNMATTVSATADPDTIFEGEITTLEVNHPGDEYTYQWNNEGTFVDGPSASETRNPDARPTETTPYQVMVTNTANGCSTIVPILVTVVTECDEPFIFIPNAFSPNDDSFNDRLLVRSVVIDDLYFVIYNRWGEKVYETEDIGHQGWDGTHNGEKVCTDVYGYYLRARCINGKEYVKKGNITVLK